MMALSMLAAAGSEKATTVRRSALYSTGTQATGTCQVCTGRGEGGRRLGRGREARSKRRRARAAASPPARPRERPVQSGGSRAASCQRWHAALPGAPSRLRQAARLSVPHQAALPCRHRTLIAMPPATTVWRPDAELWVSVRPAARAGPSASANIAATRAMQVQVGLPICTQELVSRLDTEAGGWSLRGCKNSSGHRRPELVVGSCCYRPASDDRPIRGPRASSSIHASQPHTRPWRGSPHSLATGQPAPLDRWIGKLAHAAAQFNPAHLFGTWATRRGAAKSGDRGGA